MGKKKKKSKKSAVEDYDLDKTLVSKKKAESKKKGEPKKKAESKKKAEPKKRDEVKEDQRPPKEFESKIDAIQLETPKETYTLDAALHSTKKTESTLQDLLQGISDGTGFYHRQDVEEEKIEPQLAHETKSKDLAAEYVKEELPIIKPITTVPKRKPKEEPKPPESETVDEITVESVSETPSQEISENPPPLESGIQEVTEELELEDEKVETEEAEEELEKIEVEEVVEKDPMDEIYGKLAIFIEEYQKSVDERYNMWENQVSNILAILRKMRKITQKNTEELEKSIKESYDNIQEGLTLFKQKRDEVERVADVDLKSMSGEFRRVLGLLELQVKEYRLKKITDEYFHTIEGIQ